jgi:hypothetical protein
MRKILTRIIVLLIGLFVLAGYLFQSQLGPFLRMIFDWGILILGVAGLLGIGYLLRMHLMRLTRKEKRSFFSIVVLAAFLITLVLGLVLTLQNTFYQELILNVQIPVEASLLSILAITMLYASLRVVKTQGWRPISIGYLAGALISLILNLSLIPVGPNTILNTVIAFLRRLPLAGARGILIGMALGGIIVGLRVLLTIDRPYGEDK